VPLKSRILLVYLDTKHMNSTIQTLLRSVLKIGGGALAAKGISDEATIEAAIGGLIAIAGIVWGIFHRKKTP
jgi:hypothetical protein